MENPERVQCLWCGTVKNEDIATFEDGYPFCDDACLLAHTEYAQACLSREDRVT